MNKPFALMPNPVFQGLLPFLFTAAPPGTVQASGVNFLFTATSLLIKNVDEGKWYKPFVVGAAGVEQLDFGTEVVSPVAVLPAVTGDNYQFATGAILRIKHDSSGNYHRYDWYDGGTGFELAAGVASSPAVSVTTPGTNYRFVGAVLQFKDLSGGWFVPALVGPAASQQWVSL